MPPNSRGSATMASHVIVEVSVFDLHEPHGHLSSCIFTLVIMYSLGVKRLGVR